MEPVIRELIVMVHVTVDSGYTVHWGPVGRYKRSSDISGESGEEAIMTLPVEMTRLGSIVKIGILCGFLSIQSRIKSSRKCFPHLHRHDSRTSLSWRGHRRWTG